MTSGQSLAAGGSADNSLNAVMPSSRASHSSASAGSLDCGRARVLRGEEAVQQPLARLALPVVPSRQGASVS